MGKRAYVISVNMGYGHQRTAFPLKKIAPGNKFINANDYRGIPEKDKKMWERARMFYEFISRFKRVPIVGSIVFSLYDRFQRILNFYPKKDLSKPDFQVRQFFSLFKKGWGKHFIEELAEKAGKRPLPIIATFFIPAFMAEFFNYPGEIYCVVCDADISRSWAPFNPQKSRIKYFAPNSRTADRLQLYGIKKKNIFLTGYPLPEENIGEKGMSILKKDLRRRLSNLDPEERYFKHYSPLVKSFLGNLPKGAKSPLTLAFAVGGAGAQKKIGKQILYYLKEEIKKGDVKLILIAGIREEVNIFFESSIKKAGFKEPKNVEVVFDKKIEKYFEKFNKALRKTDILWTKPSELSFYSALGIPILVAPPVGSQEDFNKRWLLKSGFGIAQRNIQYINQWLFDWLKAGYFAEAAMQGFIEGRSQGTKEIKKIVFSKKK